MVWNGSILRIIKLYLESCLIKFDLHLRQATKNPFYLHVGRDIMNSLNNLTRVECGFATVHSVLDKTLEDRMESFFLSETCKYLYLVSLFNNETFYALYSHDHTVGTHQYHKVYWHTFGNKGCGRWFIRTESPILFGPFFLHLIEVGVRLLLPNAKRNSSLFNILHLKIIIRKHKMKKFIYFYVFFSYC